MQNNQIVLVVFFEFEGFFNKFWAFKSIGFNFLNQKLHPSITFSKLMGSGGEDGFSKTPNFGKYCWLSCWESEKDLDLFIQNNKQFAAYIQHSKHQIYLKLNAIAAHGVWDEIQPFTFVQSETNTNPIVVLTRARIKKSLALKFWSNVGNVAQNAKDSEGHVYSIGVGTLPFIEQATLSIWKNIEMMKKFAYTQRSHADILSKTKKFGWYSEELFARFSIHSIYGTDTDFINKIKKQLEIGA
jgi:hypothetical protein